MFLPDYVTYFDGVSEHPRLKTHPRTKVKKNYLQILLLRSSTPFKYKLKNSLHDFHNNSGKKYVPVTSSLSSPLNRTL